MKQRLLLALLMVFASVGLAMGQEPEPSVGFKIVGTGPITINFRAEDISKGELPRLVDAAGNSLGNVSCANDEDLVSDIVYSFSGTGDPVFFIDSEEGEPIDDFTNVEFRMNGQVSEFEVLTAESFYVARELTSLTITGGALEKLKIGEETSVENDCSYLPKLNTLNVDGNKLGHIPAKHTINQYQVYTQSPEDIIINVPRNDDNSITISAELLKEAGLFTVAPATGYIVEFPADISANREGNTYNFTPKDAAGRFVQGEVTVNITLSTNDPNYPRVVLQGIKLNIPKPTFTFNIDVLGNVEGCSATAYSDVAMNNEIVDGASIEVGTIYIYVEYDEDAAYIKDLTRENLDLVDETVGPDGALQSGLYTYHVTGLGDPSFVITFAEKDPEKANIATEGDQGTKSIKIMVDELDLDTEAPNPSAIPTDVYVVVEANEGYIPTTISVSTEDGKLDPAPYLTRQEDGTYKTGTIALKKGLNTFVVKSKLGATVSRYFNETAATGEMKVETTNGATVVITDRMTVEEGTFVKVTLPTVKSGWKLVSVTQNGTDITNSLNNVELKAGNNHFVANYESIAASSIVVFGTDKYTLNPEASEFEAGNVSAGDEISITLNPSANEKITGVEINGQSATVDGSTYKGKAVAGQNVINVHVTVNPTLGATQFYGLAGTVSTDNLVKVEQDGKEVAVGAALAEGVVTITVTTPTQDYEVREVLFNGEVLTLSNGVYTGEVKAGVNTVTVYYRSTIVNAPIVDVVNGETSWVSREQKGNTVTIKTIPGKGFGVEAVLLNALTSGDVTTSDQVETVTPNSEYKAKLQPGDNKITVIFTDKAVITAEVIGIESYTMSDGDITISGVENALGGTFEPGKTSITVAAKESIKQGDVTYNLQSLTINGHVVNGAYTLGVGTNHIVAAYVSQAGTILNPVQIGGTGTVEYKVGTDGTFAATLPTINAGDQIYVKVSNSEANALRHIYFNTTELPFDKDTYTTTDAGTVAVGDNVLYVFYGDAAEVEINHSGGGDVSYSGASLLKEGSEVTFTITPDEGYAIKTVYFRGENVTGRVNNGEFTGTVESGLNTLIVEFEYVEATIKLNYNATAGSVTPDQETLDANEYTKYESVEFTVAPAEGFTNVEVEHNGKPISVNGNEFTVTLVAGENNINVEFKKQLEGNLLVKYESGVADLTITDQNGNDVTEQAANGEIVNAPAKTLLDITFKVGNSAADLVGKKVMAVINGKPYTAVKMNPDGDNTFEINDVILPEGLQSVLKVYVKDLRVISVELDKDEYTYDGTPKSVEYTTVPFNPVGMTVEYSSNGTEWRDEEFTEVGDYHVRFYRPADDVYAELSEVKDFSITKAELVVTTMPTVSLDSDNSTYLYTDGTVGYKCGDTYIPVEGEWSVNGKHSKGNHYTTMNFNMTEDNSNVSPTSFNNLKVCYEVGSYTGDQYTLTVGSTEVPFTLIRTNSNVIKAVISSSDLLDPHDRITIDYERTPDFVYTLYKVNEDGTETKVGDNMTSFEVEDVCDVEDVTLIMKSKDTRHDLALNIDDDNTNTFELKDISYDGTAHPFTANASSLPLVYIDGESRPAVSTYPTEVEVTYTLDGVEVPEPVDAGVYTITVHFPASAEYREYTAIGTFEIEKAKLNVVEDPTEQVSEGQLGLPIATPIAAGQYLYNSVLAGAAEVPGEYRWEDESTEIKPGEIGSGGVMQNVVFVPLDTKNIDSPVNVGDAHIDVSEGVQIVTWRAVLGEISVVDANGNSYDSGDPVRPGTILTITAKPLDDTMQEFESMKITVDNETTTVSSASTTIKVPDEGIVEVYATFKLKDNSSVIEVPTGQCAIVLPTNIRGAKLSKTGVQMVNRGESFTFTVSTLEADKDKVVVSVNGTAIQPANGVYTISNITEQQNVSVSLTSKTEVKLDIPKEYKLKDGTLIGRVTVVNNTSSDGKVYYNDELTLIAQPVEGVNFSAWSDGNKEDVRKYTVATSEVKLTASFSGVPTGIEDIESASILAGDGYILIKNVADANVTIVGMTGRIQAQQQISGDTQIRVPAGIYVVILENGQDVKQVKVIVR